MSGERVVVLGASDKPERFSYKALKMLREYGHHPLPVHPELKLIEGEKVFSSLSQITEPVDTLTMYVGPAISSGLKQDILRLNPARVIFNPGSENPELKAALKNEGGIEVVEHCTLVMLQSGSY